MKTCQASSSAEAKVRRQECARVCRAAGRPVGLEQVGGGSRLWTGRKRGKSKGSAAMSGFRFHFQCSQLPFEGSPLHGLQAAVAGGGDQGGIRGNGGPPPTRGGCADVRRECFLSRPNPKPGSQMYTQNLKKSDSNSWARALSLQGTPGLLCALAGITRHCLNSHHPQPQRTLLCRWLRRPVAWVLGPGHQTPVNSVSSNSHGASGGHPHSYAGALRRTSPACPPALI